MELPLGWGSLQVWMFVKRITDKFILGLDMLRSHDMALDLKNDMLQLDQEAITLWRPGAQS